MPRSDVVYRPTTPATGGHCAINPQFAGVLASLGIDSPGGFLELPGEIICGHPDRHVVRVVLPCGTFYVKRQHAVTRREQLRNWFAGFGLVSRCRREAAILQQLDSAGLPCPRWVAQGEDGRGRAFLMIEEVPNAVDLRAMLSDTGMSSDRRARFAEQVGHLIARIHANGFTTPDLTAKHLLVSPTGNVTPIDWQSSRFGCELRHEERIRALAALHASVANELATPRERLRVLRAAMAHGHGAASARLRFSVLARQVHREAERLFSRRSIRDQRQQSASLSPQRLVWVAGEAVCAVPDVAAHWPRPAIASPFYNCEPATLDIRLPNGCHARLIRGRSHAPYGRLVAHLRGKPWRSPGVTLGRVLFHLERYGIPAPRLLAFGQRFINRTAAEWFAVHTRTTSPLPRDIDPATAESLGRLLRALHDAGCWLAGECDSRAVFGLSEDGVCVHDITRIAIAKRLTHRDRRNDLVALVQSLVPNCRMAAEAGYSQAAGATHRAMPRVAAPSFPVEVG